MYEKLVKLFPDVDEYQMYYAQALFKSGQYQPAMQAALSVESPEQQHRMLMLQCAIKYEQDELQVYLVFFYYDYQV